MSYGATTTNIMPGAPQIQDAKETAIDGLNSSIESLARRVSIGADFVGRLSSSIIGVAPEEAKPPANGPRSVSQSTHDHIRDLADQIERLEYQIKRLT